MENNKQYQQNTDVTSTNFHSEAFFSNSDPIAKSRRFAMSLFERGMICSIHAREEAGNFAKKALKTHFLNSNDFEEAILMLRQAMNDAREGKSFEYVMPGKKSGFGVFGIKKEGEYVAGFAIYDANEGIVIQNSKEVCPIANKVRVKKIKDDGEQEDLVQLGFNSACTAIIGKLRACINGESNIYSSHLEKMGKKFADRASYKEPNVTDMPSADYTEDGGNDFPF